MNRSFLKITMVVVPVALMLVACAVGPKPVPPAGPIDNPEHHTRLGHEFLDKGDAERGLSEFERARNLDPKYAPAYLGLALARATMGEFDMGAVSLISHIAH